MRRGCSVPAVVAIILTGTAVAVGGETQAGQFPRQTFAVRTYVGRSYNYLDNMVDQSSQPYFNVFWTDPAEAAHNDWDFCNVISRQLQSAIMARHLTGKEARYEKVWAKKALSYLNAQTGLAMRPQTTYSDHVANVWTRGSRSTPWRHSTPMQKTRWLARPSRRWWSTCPRRSTATTNFAAPPSRVW